MRTGTLRDANVDRIKFNKSVARTVERFEGKMALMATWEAAGGDKEYLQQLRAATTKLRAQLRVKGVVFKDDDE
jgi:hypothetical protein